MKLASYFVFLALIETSFAVVCYHCSTNGNVMCNATVGNDTTTMNCANNSEYCTASLSSGVYTRGCGASCNESATGVETKCCMVNKCNGNFDKIVDSGGENTTPPTNGTIPAPSNGTTPVPLQCYTCGSLLDCSTKTVCQSNEKYCKTSTTIVPIIGSSVQKTCEVDCTPSSGGVIGLSEEVKCCQTNLCNAGSTLSPPVPLQCYTCGGSSDCSTKTVCQSNEKYCKTSTTIVPIIGSSVQKTCEVDCKPSFGAVIGFSGEVKCCQISLCNADSTVSIGFLALLLALLSASVV